MIHTTGNQNQTKTDGSKKLSQLKIERYTRLFNNVFEIGNGDAQI